MRKIIVGLLSVFVLFSFPFLVLAEESIWPLASQYDLSVMPQVLINRIHWGQIQPRGILRTVYLAGPDCSAIGEYLWIRPQNWVEGLYAARQGWEQAIISDCPGDWGAADFLSRLGVPYEIDGETIARWGYPRGRGVPVEVRYERPWELLLEEVR